MIILTVALRKTIEVWRRLACDGALGAKIVRRCGHPPFCPWPESWLPGRDDRECLKTLETLDT
jgi:hypothetical protein